MVSAIRMDDTKFSQQGVENKEAVNDDHIDSCWLSCLIFGERQSSEREEQEACKEENAIGSHRAFSSL